MKKIIVIIGLFLIYLSITAQNHYYYKGQRIYLQEDTLVRYVGLRQTVSLTEAREFYDSLNRY